MNKVFLFQGQSSQFVGMGKDLYENFVVAKDVFDEVDDSIKSNLSSLIFNGPQEELDLTVNTQPALMASSMATLRVLEHLSGKKIDELCNFVAGHSLGEYTALAATGVVTLSDCATLLRIRGKAMQDAVPLGTGLMAAVIGAELSEVEELCNIGSIYGICQIANDNCPGQIVISGHKKSLDYVNEVAKERGKKIRILPVSAPFHSSLMDPVKKVMSNAFKEVKFSKPSLPIYMNVTALKSVDIDEIKKLLIKQISSRVRWRESLLNMSNDDAVEDYIEIGTGKVITKLVSKTVESNLNIAISSLSQIEDFVKKIT